MYDQTTSAQGSNFLSLAPGHPGLPWIENVVGINTWAPWIMYAVGKNIRQSGLFSTVGKRYHHHHQFVKDCKGPAQAPMHGVSHSENISQGRSRRHGGKHINIIVPAMRPDIAITTDAFLLPESKSNTFPVHVRLRDESVSSTPSCVGPAWLLGMPFKRDMATASALPKQCLERPFAHALLKVERIHVPATNAHRTRSDWGYILFLAAANR
ncbi:hypothetical protein HD554DRAFT_2268637 [Boletus coccyginus]|nr:hypothetical protein HD554DRAFT_2268637 [Boletus coccyginus]